MHCNLDVGFDGTAIVAGFVGVGVSHANQRNGALVEHGRDFGRLLAKVAGIGVHEHCYGSSVAPGALKLAVQPNPSRGAEPEVGSAGAARYDIEKDAMATSYSDGAGQIADSGAAVEVIKRSRLEVVVDRLASQRLIGTDLARLRTLGLLDDE